MQLENTQIAIRERGLFELLDLSLHVMRQHVWPVLLLTALGAVPMALINAWVLRDLLPVGYMEDDAMRYMWTLLLLVFIEMPFATAGVTLYLGRALFLQQPSMADLLRDLLRALPQILWYQFVVRGVLVAWLLVFNLNWSSELQGVEVLLILVCVWLALVRGIRPFLNEIVLLERNPWRALKGSIHTAKRVKLLHAGCGGELFGNWLATAAGSVALGISLWMAIWAVRGIVVGTWEWERMGFTLWLPLAMWLTAAYLAVVRFMSYLDLRIRREGWEVELQMRAAAATLTKP